jgi:signal transduction histidine kinase
VSETRNLAVGGTNRLQPLLIYPLIAVSYAAIGWLGLLFAAPPGYASAVFPSTGIAVAAMMIAGYPTLPWIYLGSLVLNVWIGHAAGAGPSMTSVVAALAIAAGVTAQAALAGWALRRAVGYPAPLDQGRDLLRFVLLSPLCCLISASVASFTLSTLGLATRADLVTNWLNWWGGDTLAVLISVPLALVVAGEPRALWRARVLPVGLPLLLFFGLFTATSSFTDSRALPGVGVIGAALLGPLLLLGTGHAQRVAGEVEERTRSLAAANRRLQAEIDERRQAEAAAQAHRMEAVTQLTGGIAHDFNNLLTVVSTNAELLQKASRSPAMQRRAAAIQRAAEHGARLTRRMLAFSRQQILRPQPVDLRQRTTALAELISRALQEDIEIEVKIPEGSWPILVDPAEFERTIVNIAANARDAMPNGGRFSVAADNICFEPGSRDGGGLIGDFVALTFADSGVGMSRETAARAFEPYFTTKEVGAGSGLGLSQVYGFAKQSGGDASIASEVGSGTSVVLRLPRAAVVAAAETPSISPAAESGGGCVACG